MDRLRFNLRKWAKKNGCVHERFSLSMMVDANHLR